MTETSKRRQILETVAGDERTSTADRLRALDLLDRLDSHPEADPDFLAWKEFAAMSDEQLDREVAALGAPNTTSPDLLEHPHVKQRIDREVERRAREMNDSLFATITELRAALTRAESLRGVPDLAQRRLSSRRRKTAASRPRSSRKCSAARPGRRTLA